MYSISIRNDTKIDFPRHIVEKASGKYAGMILTKAGIRTCWSCLQKQNAFFSIVHIVSLLQSFKPIV